MLSKKTKYALHALTYLAKKEANEPTLILEISENGHIPRKFLESILLDLKKQGILNSKMGKGGGYFLRQTPTEIQISTIIRLFNGPIALLPCVSLNYYQRCDECTDEKTCGLNKVFIDVRNETLRILENKSIQDIVDQEL
ncbi:RrF2 family transcriptional regulator [Fluviicola taffensis]|uniref:Transcriptional regulator, BadM/Rrf2 family n=1 Tax=Fluviicola taffensis (strain DSM 16823 / NCIMB 13979 / RW262) TaxID=755732 RepID=F2ICP8_FLUTR|nr:Rrf2 family transcriptional regulator [Fluviicola taffensis]AEA42275.1 transcriptional regulator, BadM/Rrf2 family [Fluviicola taffensis DSM 16823]